MHHFRQESSVTITNLESVTIAGQIAFMVLTLCRHETLKDTDGMDTIPGFLNIKLTIIKLSFFHFDGQAV